MKWKIIEATIKRPYRLNGVLLATMWTAFTIPFCMDFWHKDYDIIVMYFQHMITYVMLFPDLRNIDATLRATNGPLWTLSIELWGSMIVFGLCFLIGQASKVLRMIVLIVTMICLKDTFYVAFIFGMIVAEFHKNWEVKRFIEHKTLISYICLIPGYFMFAYVQETYGANLTIVNSGYSMFGAMLMFIFVMCNDNIKQRLSWRPLVFIGGISYSIYVIHWLFLTPYTTRIMYWVTNTFGMNFGLSFILTFLIGATAIIIIAWLMDRLIDKPCIAFSSWFAKGLVREVQARITSVKIITAGSQYMKTLLLNLRDKFHSSSTNVANVAAPTIKPSTSSSDAS